MGISKFKVKRNDDTNKNENVERRAICLLEGCLTRANRAQMFFELVNRMNQIRREASKLNLK